MYFVFGVKRMGNVRKTIHFLAFYKMFYLSTMYIYSLSLKTMQTGSRNVNNYKLNIVSF